MRAIRKPMSFILAFAILLSIIVVFPTQTKATEVEMQESGAVLDITAVGDRVNLHVWISDSPMGEVPKTFIYGHQYYLCYELINLTTGGLLNGYNYKVDMKFTQENRNLYSYQYTNSNNNWIGHTFNESGLCGGTVTVSGDVGIESSITFSVQKVRLHAWFSDTGMGETPSKYRLDNRYYLCYELINPETNNRVEGLSISVEETITRPDSTTFSHTYTNSNNNWISNVFDQVGTYGGSVKVSGDISGSVSISAQIYRVSLSECTITISQTLYTYDGTEKKPSVTVKDGTKTLTNGTDYTVSYFNNKNVGIANAAITGIGNYAGSVNKSFTISYETILLNSSKTVNISTSGSVKYYSYTPSSSTSIQFYSTGSNDTYGYLFDSNMNQLASNDDGGENSNFKITYVLTAGETYVFGCKFYSSSSTGSFTVKLEQATSDTTKPNVSLSSTNNVASSQTVTISMSDNVGIKGYYWGTSPTYSNNSYTSTSNTSISKTVDASGTYYATAVDTSGNVSSNVSITFYKTTLNANGGSVSPSSVLTKSGNSFTFPTPTRSGSYIYNGWSTSSSASSGVKSLSPSSNTAYYAVWSYSDTEKPTVSLSSTNSVASSQTVTLNLSDNVGIKGYYWGTSSTYSNNSYTSTSNTSISKTVDASGTYYATAVDTSGNVSSNMSITFYKTTLNANGGSVSPTSVLTKSGNSFTFPTPTRSGYSYVGWSTSSSASSGVKTLSPSSNTTYYAVWIYTDTQNPTVSLSSTNNVASSQTVTISLSDNVGIKGYYWGTSSTYSNNSYTSTSNTSISKTVDASGTYYATAVDTSGNVSSNVSITFYKTTLNANGGSVSPTSVLTKSGNSFTFPTPTRSNYSYVGWSTSSSASSGVKTLSPSSNTTYYAVWSYNDTQNPTVSLSSTNNVASSQTVTISLSDNVGIKGYYWGTSSTYSNNSYTSTSNTSISKTVDASGTYYATAVDTSGNVSSNVSITFYKTTLNANGGSVSPTSVLTKSGNSFTFPTPTRSNYSYVGWGTSSSTSASNAVKTLSPSSNTTYYAVWQISYETIALNSTKTVTINIAGETKYYTYRPNSDITISFYSTGGDDTKGYLYDSNLNLLESDDDSGNNHNFKITKKLTANQVYIFACEFYNEEKTGSFVIKLEENTYEPSDFSWGQDNWNFTNSYYDFGYYLGRKTYRSQMSSSSQRELANNLQGVEYTRVFGYGGTGGYIDDEWGGSCYGMSALILLSGKGLLDYSDYGSYADCLHDLSSPRNDFNVSSLVNYYMWLQCKNVMWNQKYTTRQRSNETNIKDIINKIDNDGLVLVCYNTSEYGHALLAYDYEYASYTFNGRTYQGCIKICDPNTSTGYDRYQNIYFNTTSYNWTIPGDNVYSVNGDVFNTICSDSDLINSGGFLNGSSSNYSIKNYVARIDANAIDNNRSVSKLKKSGSGYSTINSAIGDIIEDDSFVIDGNSKKTIGYTLVDTDASYIVSQQNAVNLDLTMDYYDCGFRASSAAGKSVIFDKSGYVEVTGESADYSLGMVYNNSNPTDWFAVTASGVGANKASLQKLGGGYILVSDSLSDVTVIANNKDDIATVTFSTNYDSVFIYEIDETHIGLKVDTDNNGTYETELPVDNPDIPDELILGDVDGDGAVTIIDATLIQRYLVQLNVNAFDSEAADTDGDGDISIADATFIQRWLAQIPTPYNIGDPIK